jgi:hypothetical protein
MAPTSELIHQQKTMCKSVALRQAWYFIGDADAHQTVIGEREHVCSHEVGMKRTQEGATEKKAEISLTGKVVLKVKEEMKLPWLLSRTGKSRTR